MRAKLLRSIFLFALLLAPAAFCVAKAMPEIQVYFEEFAEPCLSVSGRVVHVTNAEGESLEVFNITGVKVGSYKIDSPDKQITLNLSKGCYILRLGKITRKVALP